MDVPRQQPLCFSAKETPAQAPSLVPHAAKQPPLRTSNLTKGNSNFRATSKTDEVGP